VSPSDKDERIKELERMVGRLTMENELLRKGVRFALARENEHSSTISGSTPCEIQDTIRLHGAGHESIKWSCQVMDIPHSSYYYKPQTDEAKRKEDMDIKIG